MERRRTLAVQKTERRLAEKELDSILDLAIVEFEEEAALEAKVDEAAEAAKAAALLGGQKIAKRVDKAMEEEMRKTALEDMVSLVDNLDRPEFKDTLAMTLQALSGHSDGIKTIEDLMNDRRQQAERATPDHAPEVELDRTVVATMAALGTESRDMAGLETAQMEHFGEEMMTNMIAEFEKLGQKEDFDQIVQNMMRQLLARELMYEPVKLVCEKYPSWLAEKYDTLTTEEYMRYGTQYQYFQRLRAVYDFEPDNFDRLTELLKDLQEFGPVPAEIIKELAPGLEFSSEGMPVLPQGQSMMPTMGVGPMAGMAGLPFPDSSAATSNCTLM